MTKDRKIILAICIILIIAIISIGIVPKVTKRINATKEYFEHEVYNLINEESLNLKKEQYIIAESNYDYNNFINYKDMLFEEDDLEEIENKDFDNFNYLLILVPLNTCGEDIDFDDIEINESKKKITVNMILEASCGVCAPSYELHEIKVPKKVNEYDYSIKIKWDTKEANCDPNVAYKPVLYLYPEKQTNIKVNFAHEDYLTTTYPKFNKEWNVIANPNGDLYDSNNNYYYALYWEEKDYKKVNFNEGFYVSSSNAINFLEEKLTILGLNPKEKNEFIMYWLPILENNKHNLIYFELTENLQSDNELIITPKPDTLIRIRMHVKKIDKETDIKEQQLIKQERIGYTAVEWGGVIHN